MSNPAHAVDFDLEAAWSAALREMDREVAAAREVLGGQRLTVCLAGALGSGRAALLGALQGSAAGAPDRHPLPAEPAELMLWSPPDRPEIRFALPPAFQDVAADRRAEAERFVREQADVLVFAFNANAGVTAGDQAALRAFRSTGKPFLVVFHKTETLRPADRAVVLNDARERLELADAPPVGVSTATGEGVPEFQDRLRMLLETGGKAILLDRWRAARAGEAERVVAATLAAVETVAGATFTATMHECVRAAVRLACLGGREDRLERFRDVLCETLASPRTRELASAPAGTGAADRERSALMIAFAYAVLRTAEALFLSDVEPDAERLRSIFQGRMIERRLALALGAGQGAAASPGRAFDLLSQALRSGELSPARLAAVLSDVKEDFSAWRKGRINEEEFSLRVGARVRREPAGTAVRAAPQPLSVQPSTPDPAPPPETSNAESSAGLGGRARGLLEGVAGDVVQKVWESRVRPRLDQWTEEQKALLSVDLLKLRAELEADIDRKYGDLLRKTRQEAEEFMSRTVATVNAQAEEAERRARQRLWISSLFILGWAVLGLIYALARKWLGGP